MSARLRSLIVAVVLLPLLAACQTQLPDPDSPGARMYASRCGGCHRLYEPGVLKFEMWKVTIARMQGEFARRGIPPLTEDERTTLLAYLQQHSG